MADPAPWDDAYREGAAPWDIGEPQPRLADLPFAGRVIDVGCGTGEHALLAAARGADAVGVDFSPVAIELARRKAVARGLTARFEVGDALELSRLGETFDVAVDAGVYHTWEVETRRRYAGELAAVVRTGGALYLMCFSELTPGDWGPQRIREEELRETFAGGWSLETLERATFELNPGLPVDAADAWFLAATRR